MCGHPSAFSALFCLLRPSMEALRTSSPSSPCVQAQFVPARVRRDRLIPLKGSYSLPQPVSTLPLYTYLPMSCTQQCYCATTIASNLNLLHDGCTKECANNGPEICGRLGKELLSSPCSYRNDNVFVRSMRLPCTLPVRRTHRRLRLPPPHLTLHAVRLSGRHIVRRTCRPARFGR